MEMMIADRCWRDNIPLPESIENAPILMPGLELYFNAFISLNTCRPMGWGFAPIPWTAIDQYASSHEFEYDQRLALEYYIRKMDNALESWHEKRKDGDKSRPAPIQQKNVRRFR